MHILFAVLNWGMGHASRSVPLIRALTVQGVQVSLASDGVAAELLRKEFPELVLHELPGYKVNYPSRNIYLNVLLSAISIMTAIRREQRWLRQLHKQQLFDAVISDNRYGIRLKGVRSVLITHQLRLYGQWSWANRIGEFFIRRWIQRYDEVWIPDWQGSDSLTGGMAEWKYERPVRHYLGPLSRFKPVRPAAVPDKDIIAILSGPEPQRSHFERAVREQIASIPGQHVLIRGTRDKAPTHWPTPPNLQIMDLLPAEELQQWIARSKMQVSRSGYSTVMDLVYSGLPALMVATPGQFEQEFLCTFLQGKGPWTFQEQDQLQLAVAWKTLDRWKEMERKLPDASEAKRAVEAFLDRCAN